MAKSRWCKSKRLRCLLEILSELLPIELTNGNEGRTKHFGASAARRKKYERLLRQIGQVRIPLAKQVDVVVTRVLGPRQQLMDSTSLGRGNWKEIEDALVACGWFVDDGPKQIRCTLFLQDDSRRDIGPAVLIEIFETGSVRVVE